MSIDKIAQKKYLHIVIYLTYECNLRCSYCVINFDKISLRDGVVDGVMDLVNDNKNRFEKIYIEFIWWEPLLQKKQIDNFLTAISWENIRFQITTNGTLLTTALYEKIIERLDIVNLSYNENYFNNPSLFNRISSVLINKKKVYINFIYDPKRSLQDIKENFLIVVKNGYTHINILPIVLVHEYTSADFGSLMRFISFVWNFNKNVDITFLYYIQEKDEHFEFTIDPYGNVLWDNMWTAEEFFWIKSPINTSIWKIGELTIDDILLKLNNYSYSKYLENLCLHWKTEQSYINLLLLSNLLKKYDKEVRR